MRELLGDPFYEQIKAYSRCIIDYCLLEADVPHQGYRSHKDAIMFAMCKVIERYLEYQLKAEIDFNKDRPQDIDEDPFPWTIDMDKAEAESINAVSFLQAPNVIGKDKNGRPKYDCQLPDVLRGDQLSYWYAFWETPHKTGYGKDDFDKINHVLFPNGAEALEVYEWTTDWSNYFDDGHEWWGAACWSVYDRSLNRYVVIMASTTD